MGRKKASREAAPHVASAIGYARAAADGKIVVCSLVRLAAERFLDDLEHAGERGFVLDSDKAEHVCRIAELLPHVKGRWAKRRESLVLQPWQCFSLVNVFGWKSEETGLRRFRYVYQELARKNGKSDGVARVGLYMGFADGEEGAEVYSAATTRDQAKIVWSMASSMAKKTAGFRDRFGVQVYGGNSPKTAGTIASLDTGSKFEPVSADASSLDGLNPHCAIIDEFHAHRTRDVYDVMETAIGARDQPIIWVVTTAGYETAGPCAQERSMMARLLEGEIEDDARFAVIYTLDKGDDPYDEAVWAKANPNLGVSVGLDYLRDMARAAKAQPAREQAFLTKNLNLWVSSNTGLVGHGAWQACKTTRYWPAAEELATWPCYIGMDAGEERDISSVVRLWVAPSGIVFAQARHWLPREALRRRAATTGPQLAAWAAAGHLTLTDGNAVDYGRLQEHVEECLQSYRVERIGYDPWHLSQLASSLLARGAPIVKIPQTSPNLCPATDRLLTMIEGQTIAHDGDPVLAWMVGNLSGHEDAKGNIFPRKPDNRPEAKIDGVTAMLNALALWMGQEREAAIEPEVFWA